MTVLVGLWVTRVLSWGPDLVRQPGMLIRALAWDQVGGLDARFAAREVQRRARAINSR